MAGAAALIARRPACAAGLAARRPACAAMLAIAGLAAAAAPGDDALRVEGQCRDGQAQGAYALRSAEGRLRVQGAFNLGQRVGSFIFWNAAGARIAHLPFDGDLMSGTVSLWYDAATDGEPARKLEAGYRRGERHGQTRSWYPGGGPRVEAEYADGTLQAARAWTEGGAAYDSSEARTLAERDRAGDTEVLDRLLAIVRRHPPDCSVPPPPQLRANPTAAVGRKV